jgi:hypothetical protein
MHAFKIVSSEALPKRLRDCGESASDDAAFDDEDDGSVCELLLLNLCGKVFDFSHFSLSPSCVCLRNKKNFFFFN